MTGQSQAAHFRNISFSVAGTALPLIAGLAAIPMLLAGLGKGKLGLFTLALGLFGFTGLFDLGLGRALTRTVAHELGRGRPRSEVAGLMRRGLEAIAMLGCLWGIAIFLAAPHFADALHLQDRVIRDQAVMCVRILAVLVPFALLASGFNGSLEGDRAFRTVNVIRAPIGVATYLAPALVAIGTHSLVAAVATLAVVRLAGFAALLVSLSSAFPKFWSTKVVAAGSLWRYSGWLTVSNIIGPLLTTADRYYLATVFPPAVIASYTVAFDTIYRLTAFPFGAIGAVFPSLTNPRKTMGELRGILELAARGALIFWAIPLLLGSMFVEQLLTIWLGPDFASTSSGVARWLIAGVLVNGFTLVPFMALQAENRVATTIKFHLLEVVPYAAILLVLTRKFGISGAAMAWTSRVVIDAFLQFGAARKLHRPVRDRFDRLLVYAIIGVSMVFIGNLLPLWSRVAVALILTVFAIRLGMKFFEEARRG